MTPEERARTIAYLDLAEGRGGVPLLDDAGVRELLATARRIAVIGASDRPGRPSGDVFRHLLSVGYDCVPVNPMATAVAGVPAYPTLADAVAATGPFDIVDVFRRAGVLCRPRTGGGRRRCQMSMAPARDRGLGSGTDRP